MIPDVLITSPTGYIIHPLTKIVADVRDWYRENGFLYEYLKIRNIDFIRQRKFCGFDFNSTFKKL